MPSPTPVDWHQIRRLYVDGDEPVAAIARRFGLAPKRIYDHARKQDWPRRSARSAIEPAPSPTSKVEAPDPNPPTLPTGLAARRTLVRRLYRAIDTKLKIMEQRMEKELASSRTPQSSSADHERDTRAIATLIKTLESVTELEVGLDRPADGSPRARNASAAPDARTLADEADRFRRELAERLHRLTRTGN
jgi:hypothetical protein